MEWTTDVPKETGWYWAADSKYPDNEPEIVEVYKNAWYDDELSVNLHDMSYRTRVEDQYDLWIGPLPVPPK